MSAQADDELLFRAKGDRLASGSVYSLSAMIATRLATIINSVVIIRVLQPNDYGVLSIIVLTVGLAAGFSTFSIPSALVKVLSSSSKDRPDEAGRLLSAGFTLTLITTVVTIAVLAVLAPILAFRVYDDPRLESLLLVAALALALSSIFSPLFSTFQGFEKIKELGLRNLVSAFLSIPSTVILVLMFALEGAVIAMVVNNVISILVNLALLRRIWSSKQLHLKVPGDRQSYRQILDYAVPLLLSVIVVTAALWVCGTLLQYWRSFADVGRYQAGFGLSSYILFVSSAVGIPLVPIISKLQRESPDELPPFIARTLRVGAFLTLVPALVLVALPEPFLRILYGESYVGASNVVRLVAPAIYLASIGGLIGYGMAGTGQVRGALAVNVVWAVSFMAVSPFFILAWGDVGLALGVLCAYIIQFVALLTFTKLAWSVELRDLTATLLIAAVSLPTAAFISFYMGQWRFELVIPFIAAAAFASITAMSKRELEVLSMPLKRVTSWVRPRH